jgi:hypothetical protein
MVNLTNMRWLFMHILCALNVKIHILVDEKTVLKL